MSAPLNLRTAARALGGEVSGSQVLAPGPGHSRKDRSLSIRFGGPNGFVVHSHAGDDWRDCRDHVKERLGIPRETAPSWPQEARGRAPTPPQDGAQKARALAAIVAEMRPVWGSPGERYLRDARKIDVDVIRDVAERTDAVGWHPSVYFNGKRDDGGPPHPLHGKRLGAIIGVMSDPTTGEATGGISRTYVHEGRKVDKARSLGPAGIMRLSEDADVLGGLFIAEGLETCLAGMAIGLRPMWSTGSTAQMTAFPVLSGIEALTIIADNDPTGAGEKAARAGAERWASAGREVEILTPHELGDLNDVVRRIA